MLSSLIIKGTKMIPATALKKNNHSFFNTFMAGEYICPNNGRLKKWETCLKTVTVSAILFSAHSSGAPITHKTTL